MPETRPVCSPAGSAGLPESLRLVFLSTTFPAPGLPQRGTFNAALISHLAKHHAIHAIAPVPWPHRLLFKQVQDRSSDAPVEAPPATLTTSYPTFFYPPKVLRSKYDLFLGWSIGTRIEREIALFRPDAVISYWAHPDGAVALKIAKRLGVPAISMVGGSDVLLLGRAGPRRRAILNVLNGSNAIVAVSQNIADCLISDGLPHQRIHVVRRGVDTTLFSPGCRLSARHRLGVPAEATVLLAVGRLVPVKGHEFLISACRLLSDRGVNVQCYIVGDGPLKDRLAVQVRALQLEDVVHLVGGQPQTSLADWYRCADITVLPSLSEGIPNVLLESIACGTPFVASNVGGVAEIVDSDLHCLVPSRDASALADAIRQICDRSPGRHLTKTQVGSWDDSADRLIEIVRDAIRRAHS